MIPDCIRIRDTPPISKGWMVGEVAGGGAIPPSFPLKTTDPSTKSLASPPFPPPPPLLDKNND